MWFQDDEEITGLSRNTKNQLCSKNLIRIKHRISAVAQKGKGDSVSSIVLLFKPTLI
jgi:hypothetical protein